MYDSLKAWMNVSVTVKPFVSRSGNGDKVFGTSYTLSVYPFSEIKLVKNDRGEDVVSSTRLYMDGSSTISKHDSIVFEGEERPIQVMETYYRNGVPDLRVVYL